MAQQTLRDKILAARAANPAQARQRGAALRAQAVVDQFTDLAKNAPQGRVDYGGVTFYSVTALPLGGIAVRTAPDAIEDDFRIFNPPTLVRDAGGDLLVHRKPHREDPLGAVARVILELRAEKGSARR
jgi:hypothetical protein